MEPLLLYITASNREEAILLSHDLLSHRLIACANIFDHATSLYWWQGEIEQHNEAVIIAKTMSKHLGQINERVKSLHSYSCPCVVTVPITGGSPEFMEWIRKETTRNDIAE
jgi:periplasmic divalent cation tolerance protein